VNQLAIRQLLALCNDRLAKFGLKHVGRPVQLVLLSSFGVLESVSRRFPQYRN
jgi:hypothetical protein